MTTRGTSRASSPPVPGADSNSRSIARFIATALRNRPRAPPACRGQATGSPSLSRSEWPRRGARADASLRTKRRGRLPDALGSTLSIRYPEPLVVLVGEPERVEVAQLSHATLHGGKSRAGERLLRKGTGAGSCGADDPIPRANGCDGPYEPWLTGSRSVHRVVHGRRPRGASGGKNMAQSIYGRTNSWVHYGRFSRAGRSRHRRHFGHRRGDRRGSRSGGASGGPAGP